MDKKVIGSIFEKIISDYNLIIKCSKKQIYRDIYDEYLNQWDEKLRRLNNLINNLDNDYDNFEDNENIDNFLGIINRIKINFNDMMIFFVILNGV